VPDATVSHRVMGTRDLPSFSATREPVLLSAYQTVPPAPGRESGTDLPAKGPTDGGGAPAPPGLGGGLLPILIMVVPILLLLFFTSRSQQKKQAAVLANLKKGDRVLLQSGLVGRFVEVKDRYATIDLGSGVKVEVLKSSIAGQDSPEAQASVEKK
jgi:preprotein translocase subunit YajC